MRGVTLVRVDGEDMREFQPALPMRGVTLTNSKLFISSVEDFNPHSPCGE